MELEKKFTEDMLRDGSRLFYIKSRFLSKKTPEQLNWLMACIRDSELIVPIVPATGEPDFLENDYLDRYLALFSQEEQLPEDYREQFELKRMKFHECVELAKSFSMCDGLVLDGLSEAMVLEYDMVERILKVPSRLYPEGEE